MAVFFRSFLVIVTFFMFANILFASKKVVSLEVKTKIDIPDDFQSGMEEELTVYGYSLCQENACDNVPFKVKVDIIKKSDKVYRFKAKFIDTVQKRVLSIKSLYFKGSIDDYEKLMAFGKDLTKFIVKNIKKDTLKYSSKQKKSQKGDSNKNNSEQKDTGFSAFDKMEEMIEKRQTLHEVKPVQNKNNTDLFYDSVITHPQIINIR